MTPAPRGRRFGMGGVVFGQRRLALEVAALLPLAGGVADLAQGDQDEHLPEVIAGRQVEIPALLAQEETVAGVLKHGQLVLAAADARIEFALGEVEQSREVTLPDRPDCFVPQAAIS